MRRTVIAAVVFAGLLVPPGASAQSAFPLKSPGDSGVINITNFNMSNWASIEGQSNLYVRGYDACTYTAPYSQFTNNYQQYNVGNCAPVQTPWIKLKGWETKGWATYCPGSAPNSWINSVGGALQQITSNYDVENMNEIMSQNSYGPSPPAKNDYYTTNWGFHTHYWMFLVGCSPQAWQNVGDGGNYCCDQGTSAIPNFSQTASARTAAAGRRAQLVKGPAVARRRVNSRYYTETREADLVPSTRRTYRASCAGGHRLTSARHGIGYYTGRKPTGKDGDYRESRKPFGKRGFQVTVRTDKRIKRGKVRIQLNISCARPGGVPTPGR